MLSLGKVGLKQAHMDTLRLVNQKGKWRISYFC